MRCSSGSTASNTIFGVPSTLISIFCIVSWRRVQVDVCKITGGVYQYTAIDDCSRWQVADIFPRKTAVSTVAFLKQVQAAMPFPIQRIQTDRGQEFFAYRVQDQLRDWRIKFRPTRPRSPHLNGKVERVQRTALEEFWSSADLG